MSKNIDEMCKFTRKNDFKTVRHRFFKYNIGKMVNISITSRWQYAYCTSTKVEEYSRCGIVEEGSFGKVNMNSRYTVWIIN